MTYKSKQNLDRDLFASIVASSPLVSIDLIVTNSHGEILLGLRTNRPAQGSWFVPGGRIRKDESIAQAFKRITMDELGVRISQQEGELVGIYEHFYPDNFSGDEFSTHYIVLAHRLTRNLTLEELPAEQHASFRWWQKKELLQSDNVHLHSKWYFEPASGMTLVLN